jgi:hypothetical protein
MDMVITDIVAVIIPGDGV